MRVKQFMRSTRTVPAFFALGFSLLLAVAPAAAASNGSMGPVSSGSLSISVKLMPRFQLREQGAVTVLSTIQSAVTSATPNGLCIKSNVKSSRFSIKLVQPPGSSPALLAGWPGASSECVKVVEAGAETRQPSPSPNPNARAFIQPVTLLISAE